MLVDKTRQCDVTASVTGRVCWLALSGLLVRQNEQPAVVARNAARCLTCR